MKKKRENHLQYVHSRKLNRLRKGRASLAKAPAHIYISIYIYGSCLLMPSKRMKEREKSPRAKSENRWGSSLHFVAEVTCAFARPLSAPGIDPAAAQRVQYFREIFILLSDELYIFATLFIFHILWVLYRLYCVLNYLRELLFIYDYIKSKSKSYTIMLYTERCQVVGPLTSSPRHREGKKTPERYIYITSRAEYIFLACKNKRKQSCVSKCRHSVLSPSCEYRGVFLFFFSSLEGWTRGA